MAPEKRTPELPLVKIVGVSASGKSTLVQALRVRGYNARPVSQEHSNVPDLWQQFDKPRVLILLDVTLDAQRQRRPDVTWTRAWHFTELNRLHHARSRADLQVNTSDLTPAQVLEIVLVFLEHAGIAHGDAPLPPLSATGTARDVPSRGAG